GYNPAMLGQLLTTLMLTGRPFNFVMPPWLDMNDIWRMAQTMSSEDNLIVGFVTVAVVGIALFFLAPNERKHIRAAVIVFVLGSLVVLISIPITLYGAKGWGSTAHTVEYLLGG